MTHSLSKFLFGIEIFYHVIRSKIHLELAENAAWYLGRSNPKSDNCNSSAPSGNFLGNFIRNSAAGILIGTEPHEGSHLYPAFTTEEYDDLLSAAVPTYADQAEWSPFDHCQMISNILKRPICLFSALSDLNKGESFTFLPLRHPPEECYKYPISIAWQSRGKDNSLRYSTVIVCYRRGWVHVSHTGICILPNFLIILVCRALTSHMSSCRVIHAQHSRTINHP